MSTRSLHRHRSRTACVVVMLASAPLRSAFADCIDDAAARHQVNAVVLRAIGWQESRLQPQALGRNANGSIDIGAFQINSIHLSELGRYGIDRAALADGCTSAEVAAWHYRRQVERQGNSWRAVGAYHSATPGRAAWYANQIAAILVRWRALPAAALPFPPGATLAPDGPPNAGTRSPLSAPIASTSPSSPGTPAAPSAQPAAIVPPERSKAYAELAYLPPTR